MMDREWRAILNRYGQSLLVCTRKEGEQETVRAFLQPVREKQTAQTVPSPLGLRREDRFLYLGPADTALFPRQSQVSCQGQNYEVQTAQKVGESHWWAILRPVGQEEKA
jgi:hypothetical protein